MNTLVPSLTQLTTSRAGLVPWRSSTTPESLAAGPSCPLLVLDTLNWVHSPAVAGWVLMSAASTIGVTRIGIPKELPTHPKTKMASLGLVHNWNGAERRLIGKRPRS